MDEGILKNNKCLGSINNSSNQWKSEIIRYYNRLSLLFPASRLGQGRVDEAVWGVRVRRVREEGAYGNDSALKIIPAPSDNHHLPFPEQGNARENWHENNNPTRKALMRQNDIFNMQIIF